VLDAAIRFLIGETIAGETLLLGDSVEGTITPKTRIQHLVNLSAGDIFSIILESNTAGENIILRVLDSDSLEEIAETGPDTITGFIDVEFDEDVSLILEVRAEDGTATVDYTLTVEEGGE